MTIPFGFGLGLLLDNALIYSTHYDMTPGNHMVRNVNGPWVWDEEERRQLKKYLLEGYSGEEHVYINGAYITFMFETIGRTRQLKIVARRSDTSPTIFGIHAEASVNQEISDLVKTASSQEGITNLYTVRVLRGDKTIITESNREAVIHPYVTAGGSKFGIGELGRFETFASLDEAVKHAKQLLEIQSCTDEVQEYPGTTSQVKWIIGTSKNLLEWVVTITNMVVSKRGRVQGSL